MQQEKSIKTIESPTERLSERSFLHLRGGNDLFSTENWKSSDTSLFCPVNQDMYINVCKYDQVSVAGGTFHVKCHDGTVYHNVEGHVLHCWRFNHQEKRLYIALTVLFTNQQKFRRAQTFLQNVWPDAGVTII